MKLATLKIGSEELAAFKMDEGFVLLTELNREVKSEWKTTIFELLKADQLTALLAWYQKGGKETIEGLKKITKKQVSFAPLYRHPRKIIGIGMNYLHEKPDKSKKYNDPVSFMKPDTTIIGPEDTIHIPKGSVNTTAEAELAIIIGKRCNDIGEDTAKDYIAGFSTALDMTEADIHAENQRYLTRAKSFDTFFSFGPILNTDPEIDLFNLEVQTVSNGEAAHSNRIENMRYNPLYTVAFFSRVMTLLPGDVILTGTPGPVVLREGDQVESHISNFEPLINKVLQR